MLTAMRRQAPRDGSVRKVNDNATAAFISSHRDFNGPWSSDTNWLVLQDLVQSGAQPAAKVPGIVLLKLRSGVESDVGALSQTMAVCTADRPVG